MIITFITPSYNASSTISATLQSIFVDEVPQSWELDVIVVDDGGRDRVELKQKVNAFDQAQLLRMDVNQGKNAAVNYGVKKSRGDVVIILDADDTLLAAWPSVLQSILSAWPQEAPVCFSACRTNTGHSTVANPTYTGPFRLEDIICERYMGEYLPMFRGDAIRAMQGYRDAGRGVGCELWTYLTYASTANLWVSSEVMRIYHDQEEGTLSTALFSPQGASRLVQCYDAVFDEYEDTYKTYSLRNLKRRRLRQAVFAAIAGERSRSWSLWKTYASYLAPVDTLGALILIALGPRTIQTLVSAAKKMRLIRRYG